MSNSAPSTSKLRKSIVVKLIADKRVNSGNAWTWNCVQSVCTPYFDKSAGRPILALGPHAVGLEKLT